MRCGRRGVTLKQVINAVRKSNLDVGARTLEVNRVEYIVRGIGFIESPEGPRTNRHHGTRWAADIDR